MMPFAPMYVYIYREREREKERDRERERKREPHVQPEYGPTIQYYMWQMVYHIRGTPSRQLGVKGAQLFSEAVLMAQHSKFKKPKPP